MGKRSFISGMFIAVLVIMGGFSAFAQESTFGLSEEDFALWSQANAESAAETRFGFDFALTFDGEMDGQPGSLAANASGALDTEAGAMQLTFDVTSDALLGSVQDLSGELIILDGNFYVNVTDPTTGEPTGWLGDSLENLSGTASAGAGLPGGLDPTTSPDALQPMLDALMGAGAAVDPGAFISMSSAADGGNTVFTLNLSLSDFLASGGGAALLESILSGASQIQPGAVPPGFDANTILPLIQPLADGITITLVQSVDPAAMRVVRTEFMLGVDLPAQAPPLMLPQAVVLNLAVAIDLTSYGEALVIEVPEDVTMGVLSASVQPDIQPTIMPLPTTEAPVAEETFAIAAGEEITVDFNAAPINFTYEAAAGDVITVTAASVDESLDTTLQILDPSGLMIQYNDDHNSDLELYRFASALIEIELPEAGTYTIVLNTFGGNGSGEITVSLTSGAAAPADDPVVDEPVQGLAVTAGETNTVVFTGEPITLTYQGTAGETIDITASSEDGSLDPTLTLLNPDGDEIGFNDDHNSDLDLNRLDSALIGVELESDGVYSLVISTFAGSGEGAILVTVESGSQGDEGGKDGDSGSTQQGDGEPIVVTGEVPDDDHFEYTFDGVEGEIVTITVRATDNSLDPVTTLIGPDGDEVDSNDDHDDDDPDLERFDSRISEVELPETGEYTVSVRGFGGSGGELELTIERAGQGGGSQGGQQGQGGSQSDRVEGETETVEGSINAGEAFAYELTVNESDVFTVTAHALDEDFDPVLAIYDENGQLVTRNDDHGTGDRNLNAFDSRIERYIFREGGTYTIEVTGYRDAEGDFELIIEFVTTGAPTDEGETTEIEGSIRANGSYVEEIELEEGQFVTITVHAAGEEFDPILSLISEDGELLAINDDHGSGDRELNFFDSRITDFVITESGTYMIEVVGYNDSAGDFTLIITVKS